MTGLGSDLGLVFLWCLEVFRGGDSGIMAKK